MSSQFEPDVYDVLEVKRLLVVASNRHLPLELVDQIIDSAHYWPHVSIKCQGAPYARGASSSQDLLVLRAPPLSSTTAECSQPRLNHAIPQHELQEPREKHPAREIVWTLKSHDQGFSSERQETHGTYTFSYTWFNARIDRDQAVTPENDNARSYLQRWLETKLDKQEYADTARREGAQEELLGGAQYATLRPPIWPPTEDGEEDYWLQRNVQAKAQPTEHQIVWSYLDRASSEQEQEALRQIGRGTRTGDGKFVRSLEVGDCVSLWAHARYPAWINTVEHASVKVYFAI